MSPRPPWLPGLLLRWLLPESLRETFLGDLDEEFRERAAVEPREARRWYWRQALGARPAALRRAARRRGAVDASPHDTRLATDTQPSTGDPMLMEIARDLRYGLRMLVKSPTFTVVAVLTLALAIAVNSTIFSVIGVVFLGEMPIRDPETAGFPSSVGPVRGTPVGMSEPDFLDFRERMDSFAELAATNNDYFVVTGLDEPLRVVGMRVTANWDEVWGLEPVAGRLFDEGDVGPGAERVAALSHGSWERWFDADPGVVGRTLEIDGHPTTIVGVTPERLELGNFARTDIFLPLRLDRDAARDARSLSVSGRLAAGVSHERATQEAATIAAQLAEEHPDANEGWTAVVRTWDQIMTGEQGWAIVTMLFITVGLVLLLACANLATLMLARGTRRSTEFAIRSALGAGRSRLVRQIVLEGTLLAIIAAGVGLLVTRGMIAALAWVASGQELVFEQARIDGRVLLFTLILALLAPVLFALVPALRVVGADVAGTLKEEGVRSTRTRGQRGRKLLVAGQVALALSLMVVAGLMTRSLMVAAGGDLGMDVERLSTLAVQLPEARYAEPDAARAFFRRTLERIRSAPEVETAAWVDSRPLAGSPARRYFTIQGRPAPSREERPWVSPYAATADYLDTLGARVVRGRFLRERDADEGAAVVVLNTEAVRRYWPEDDPLGATVKLGDEPEARWRRVVGIVEHVGFDNRAIPARPQAYVPFFEGEPTAAGLVARIREGVSREAAVASLRREIWAVDADQPISDVRSMPRLRYDAAASAVTFASLFAFFALFAMVLAAAGVYGVVAFSVGQRTREFGIRMALGAHSRQVLRMVLRQAGALIGAGMVAGLVVAWMLGRLMAAALQGISSSDAWTYGTVLLVLTAAAAVATLIPAYRATRVDPVTALRE